MQRVEGRVKNEGQGQIAFACNQRDEVRDLRDVSAALCANPSVKQQTFLAKPAGSGASRGAHEDDIAATLVAEYGNHWNGNAGAYDGSHFALSPAPVCLNPWDTQQSRVFSEESASPTLAGADGGGGRNPAGLVFCSAPACGSELARTLTSADANGVRNPAGLVFCSASSQSHAGITEELAGTLTCQHEQPFICEPELARTLTARGDSSPCADRGQNVVAVHQRGAGVGINGDIAGTLDASYYKGTGERNGKEREVVLCRASGQSNAEQLENLSATLNCGAEQPIVAYDGTSALHTAAPPAITMRMREGKPGGGKGPLFQEEKSAALATRGDQYLFAPAVSVHQNGSGELSVSETAKSLTTLSTGSCRNAPLVAQTPAILCAATGQANAELAIDLCPTITEAAGTSGDNKPYIVQPCAYALQGNMLGRQPHNGPAGSGVSKDLSFTLTATDTPAVASAIPIHDKATRCEGGGPTRSGDGCGNGLGVGKPGDPAPTLTSGDHHSVAAIPINTQTATRHAALGEGTGFGVGNESSPAFTLQQAHCHAVAAVDCRNYKEVGDVSGTLQAKDKPGYSLNYQNPVRAGYIVRRLTPTECERLQGFPDSWTKFGHDGKEISDTKRYQMLGNSVAVPCVAFIMSGVSAQLLQIREEAA